MACRDGILGSKQSAEPTEPLPHWKIPSNKENQGPKTPMPNEKNRPQPRKAKDSLKPLLASGFGPADTLVKK